MTPILNSLHDDFARIGHSLAHIASETEKNEISNYPLFIASSLPIQLGIPLYVKDDVQYHWYFYASILEELVKKGIVEKEKIAHFKMNYKDPFEFACILLILPDESSFVFVPYK